MAVLIVTEGLAPGVPEMPFYLGFDCSTQSLTAVLIALNGQRREVVLEVSLPFDETLPHYGTRHGMLPHDDPAVAVSSPVMWAEALDVMLGRLSESGFDLGQVAAISGSAQQHGSVYFGHRAEESLAALDPARPLAGQVGAMLSRDVAPIWMDSSTSAECAAITEAVGGERAMVEHTGSRATERFTGPQIRRFFRESPAAYAATGRIHLVSSFLASLLAGRHAPLDPGDGSGMNLMDLATCRWWLPAVEATAPGLAAKLPDIVPPGTIVGMLSRYWRERHGLGASNLVAWSGDNPCSLIGVGLVRENTLAVSLGTSDTVFGLMLALRVDLSGTGHVFVAPTGHFMGLTCVRNGSLARERVREVHGLSWEGFSRALERGEAGNGGRILLPWFEPETTPRVLTPGICRYGPPCESAGEDVRALVEAQMMSLMLHARWMGVGVERIHVTGGASANDQILQVLADVSGADVYRLEVSNSAALGAALCAAHADMNRDGARFGWEETIAGFVEAVPGSCVRPDARRHRVYESLMPAYAACEAHALGQGADPTPLIEQFRQRIRGTVGP